MCYDPDTESVLIVQSASTSGTGAFSKISVVKVYGDTVTFGRDDNHFVPGLATEYARELAISYDTTANKAVLSYTYPVSGTYRVASRVVTVSGTSISYGTELILTTFSNGALDNLYSIYDDANDRTVLTFVDNSAKWYAYVGTVSGTSISFGSGVQVGSADNSGRSVVAYDSTNNKVVVAYADSSNSNKGTIQIGTVSGTRERIRIVYDSVNNKIVISYNDGATPNSFNMISGTVSGNSATFGSPIEYNVNNSAHFGETNDSNTGKSIFVMNVGDQTNTSGAGGQAYVYSENTTTTNLTDQNYIGVAAESISDGATGKITIAGGINSGQSGLTIGKKYYIQPNGDISTVINYPSVVAGTAISATKLVVKG
jgi:hypothetical protein